MIVDAHTHFLRFATDCDPVVTDDMRRCGIDPDAWTFTPEDHLRATSAADAAIVFGLQGIRTGWHVPNDAVLEHVRRAPERLIFFAAVDPSQPGCMEELERCHRDLRCQGVKMGPVYQGVHPLDPRCYAVYSYCARHGLPVITHMATTFSSGVPLDYARPIHMDQVACDFPALKIVLAHLGHPWEAETIAVIRKQPNVYADLSALYYRPWQFHNSMRLLVEYRAEGKVLFGSDYPATATADSLTGLRGINRFCEGSGVPRIPDDIVEGIIHRDTLSLLGLSRPRKEGSA